MNLHYSSVSERAAHRCEYCGAPEAIFNFPFEVEHIIPPGKGGLDHESNLALACRSCNIHKSDFVSGPDPIAQVTVRLFHPRLDRWAEHFQGDAIHGVLTGLTPVGRATVARLAMNSEVQKFARTQWARLGLFPPA